LRSTEFSDDASTWDAWSRATYPAVALARDQAGFVTLVVTPVPTPLAAAWTQTVPVQSDTSYYVSYRGHTEKLAGIADLRLAFYDAAGHLLWQTGGIPLVGDTGWATYAWRSRTPADATQATIALSITEASAGRAAFDAPYVGLDDAPQTRALIVDYGRVVGRMRAFRQVAYDCLAAAAPGLLEVDAVLVVADVGAIFANPWADPTDRASYDFHALGTALAAVVDSDAQVVLRLEQGAGRDPSRLRPAKWAEVVRHIVMHYNDGWASGYDYGIRYWEVASEPGSLASRSDASADYYALLAATIRALGAHDPGLKVGGPGVAAARDLAHLEGLLGYLAEHGLRLGFLSWHSHYDGSPWAGVVIQSQLQRLLDRYGLADAEVVVSDWGMPQAADGGPPGDVAYQAAHLVASAAYWHGTRLAQAHRSCSGAFPELALADAGGQLTVAGEAFRQMGAFADTPRRLATMGGDELGFALLAASSEDGNLVRIAIADTGSRSTGYRLALAGFPPGFSYVVSEISRQHQGEVIAQGEQARLVDGVLALPWRSPAVHLIEVRWEGQE
jgi:hypothetical protein